MVALQTSGDIGSFGRSLTDVLNAEKVDGSYTIQIQKLDHQSSSPLIETGHLPADTDAILVTLKKPINADATLRFVKVISQEFCRWTIEKEEVKEKRRALVIREEGAEQRNLRTVLFDDVGM
jgi:hypothetical protein